MNDERRRAICAISFKIIVVLVPAIWFLIWSISRGSRLRVVGADLGERGGVQIDVRILWYGVVATWLGLMTALARFRGDAWIDSGFRDYPFPLTVTEFRSYTNNVTALVTTACCGSDFLIALYLMWSRASA